MAVEDLITNVLLREDGIDPTSATPEQRDRYNMAATLIVKGRIQMDDESKPRQYWGSFEHLIDLLERLGVKLDPDVEMSLEVLDQLSQKLLTAQTEMIDASGNPLYRSDFALIGSMTGFTA